MGRWDRRASRLTEVSGDGTVLAACRADPPGGGGLESGLRSVAGPLGARLGRSLDEAMGREEHDLGIEQTAVPVFPTRGYVALVVGGRLVLLEGARAGDRDVVAGRWSVDDVVLVSAEEVTTSTLHVTRVAIVFGDGTSLTFDAPRQGFAKDIDRFVRLLCEAASIQPPA